MFKELIKNTGIYIIISFFDQALIFLLWIALAWWLAPAQIGIYALVLFVIEFFSAVNLFGLNAAIMRFYYVKKSVSSILSNALIVFLCSSFLSLLLFFFLAKFIPLFIPGLSNILEENLFLFLAIIFTNSIVNFAIAHYTALKKAILYAKLQLLKLSFFCFFSLIVVYFGFGILGIFYALLFSSLLVVILFLNDERKMLSLRVISFQTMKDITSYGFPLMLYTSLGVVMVYFSRLLLDRYTDLTTLGVYSFFLMLTLQVNGLWSSFNRAWTPEVFSKLSEDKEKAIENVKLMAFLSSFFYLLVLALLIIFGELFFFKILFKEIYLSNLYIFYILLLGPLFSGIYTATYPLYYYKEKTKIILFLSLILSSVNIVLTFFMIKFFGQNGAALSFFIATMLMTIVYLFTFKKIVQIPRQIINWVLLLSGLMTISVLIFLKTFSSILFLLFIIFGIFLVYRIGNLNKQKYLFINLLKGAKEKLWPKIGTTTQNQK